MTHKLKQTRLFKETLAMKALGLLILSSITGYAWAVDPFQAPNAPNAGSLLQEIERDYLKPIPKAEPKVAPKKPGRGS